jgi:hypothetical protein
MSNSIISPDEAGLLIHRFVTERVPVVALFLAEDKSVRAVVRGFVNSFTQDAGLAICTPFRKDKSIPAFLEFPHDLISALFRYSDQTEVPEEMEMGSGLRIEMPNGNNLTIVEIRDISN